MFVDLKIFKIYSQLSGLKNQATDVFISASLDVFKGIFSFYRLCETRVEGVTLLFSRCYEGSRLICSILYNLYKILYLKHKSYLHFRYL